MFPLGFLFHKVVVGPTTGNIGEILSATGNPTFHPDDRSDILEALERARQLSAWGQGAKKLCIRIGKYEHPENRKGICTNL